MGLRINTNPASLAAHHQWQIASDRLGANQRHLASGQRVATAADDAAGLAIADRLRAQVRGLDQARRNASDAVSLVQVHEGAANEMSSILVRMRSLAVEAASGTLNDTDRASLDSEFGALRQEFQRIEQTTSFNGLSAFDGQAIQVHVGANASSYDQLQIDLEDLSSLPVLSVDLSSAGAAISALAETDSTIDTVSTARATLGALQNRLSSVVSNLSGASENMAAAESRIRDVDVASEAAEMTRNSIMQQAALSIIAQANVQPQMALMLLG